MGSCTKRHFLLSVCILQLLTIIERQVFDFLGFMWAPILVNFFHIIFVIFGFFGAYQLRAKYIIIYSTWNVLWIGWNIFLVCFYLNVGILDRDSDILNLGTGSVSWFESNGIGCIPNFSINITADYPTYRPVRPDSVDGCLLDYHIVEVVHSALQIMLAVLALLGSILMAKIFIDDDDHFEFMDGDPKSPHHTAVHPVYVNYTSIPSSGSTLFLGNKRLSNLSNSRPGDSNSTSMNSLYNSGNRRKYSAPANTRPDIKYTDIGDQQYPNDDEYGFSYPMKEFRSHTNLLPTDNHYPLSRPNLGYVTLEKAVDNSNNETNSLYVKQYDSQILTSTDEINNQRNAYITSQMNDTNQLNLPYRYAKISGVNRSPKVNRNIRLNVRDRNQPPSLNHCDQIRVGLPEIPSDYYLMQRTKSQDRISRRSQRNSNNSRPRSYCSNTVMIPED